MNIKIIYPTKRQINKIADTFEDKLIHDFLGFSDMGVNVEAAVADYRKGLFDMIDVIKKLNSEQEPNGSVATKMPLKTNSRNHKKNNFQ